MKRVLVLLASVLALAAVAGGSVAGAQAAPADQQAFYWVGYKRPGLIVGFGGQNRATVYAYGRAFNSGFRGKKVSAAYGHPMRVMWWHPQLRIALGIYAPDRRLAAAVNRAVAPQLREDGWVRKK